MRENINENRITLSEAQLERLVGISECLDIVHSIADGLEDSNDAYEIASSINEFMDEFNGQEKVKLEKYSLGKLLLSPNNFDITESELDDTKDGKIAKFIKDKLASKISKDELEEAA